MAELAAAVMQRIDELGRITDEQGRLTRTFCSPAMRRANDLVASWMRQAGMAVREDAIGNLIGHFPLQGGSRTIQNRNSKVLLLGSHLDTVRDAGRFDGALGVLVAIACVKQLRENQTRLPFAVEVIGFAEEEGVRYRRPYLGSKFFAGTFDGRYLDCQDQAGITMREAIRTFTGKRQPLSARPPDPRRLLGYVEVHIEQGPVLEQRNLALGVVSGIAGQTRAQITFTGRAGHAGTTPMSLRRDALAAAAEFVMAVEKLAKTRSGLVATVGELQVSPGVSNVIPGTAGLSLDLRHSADAARRAARDTLRGRMQQIAGKRKLRGDWKAISGTPATECDRQLTRLLTESVRRHQKQSIAMTSGAGHDGAVMAAMTPVTMLFVRCKHGISHHPSESATRRDVAVAIAVMLDFIQSLARDA